MKYIIRHVAFILFLTLIWCILNNRFTPFTLITGFILSSISIIMSCRIHGGEPFMHRLNISLFGFIKFFLLLVYHIYLSTFRMIRLIFTSNVHLRLVHIDTTLKDDWSIFFLANAITLTPGTVTVNRHDHHLLILTVYPKSEDPLVDPKLIKALRKGVKH
ncbi:Na+/H+ antiporter subunit E [Vallitalea pronyensis]|uniref:Na+/H+ antiporter subunit E n=1 Tax=Vallitalea pronyensis TaxID=1348613 RepID=A0A8J8MJR4_9FIRM|nr:Na+/H+ antiporter subunit E [Vallitalea pronyensis]QUI22687.1 Na+/H+ antiporter subunit E [Vallitalea pronyensis]